MIPVVFFLLPERPADIGLRPYGETAADPVAVVSRTNPLVASFKALRRGIRSRDFWLLAGSFFVCGLSTNGLIGTHLIATCVDHGIAEFTGAGILAAIGIFDTWWNDGLGLAHRQVQQPAASLGLLRFSRALPHLSRLFRLQFLRPVDLRGLLRPRLGGDPAADGAADQRRLRPGGRPDHVRLDHGRASARRRGRGVRRGSSSGPSSTATSWHSSSPARCA